MTRIAVAGFQHETNTFAPLPTRLSDFENGGAWPPLTRGEELRDRLKGLNLPIAGFLDNCRHETVPLLWAAAEPGGYVGDEAFDSICQEITDGILESSVDAVYLDLHGAMVTRSHADGEAELLRRVRCIVGSEFPIAVSLDLHGNLSQDFFDRATVVTVYRTYPHIDIAATGARAADLLDRALRVPLKGSFRQVDLLIPLTAQSTFHNPARQLYSSLESQGSVSADICLGFPPADVHCCGPSVFAYDESQSKADTATNDIAQAILDAESQFDSRLISAKEAVRQALTSKHPTVVIADPQDNPGAGATGDTTGLLLELLLAEAPDAIFSMIHDAPSAEAAHRAGLGAEITLDIGGRFKKFSKPISALVKVVALADGPFKFTGAMFGGSTADLGRIAQLQIVGTGISVVVGSGRTQNADQEMFRVAGIEPAKHRVVCVKSSVHFLADYQQLSDEILFAEAPGANVCRLASIEYTRLRPAIRFVS